MFVGQAHSGASPEIDNPLGSPFSQIRSFCKVFAQVALAYLRKGDLWFLSYCDADPMAAPATLRSWVPDWTRRFGYRKLVAWMHVDWAASKEKKVSYRLVEEPNTDLPKLALKGVLVDTVTWVSPRRPMASKNSMRAETRQEIVDWLSNVVSAVGPGDRLKVCWALALDVYPLPLKESYGTDREREILVENSFERVLAGDGPDDEFKHLATCYFSHMMDVTCERVVFRTKSGYFGMGPLLTARGDQLVVFLGAKIPHLIRPAGHEPKGRISQRVKESVMALGHRSKSAHTGRMVGEAYVDGIIKGELFDQKFTPHIQEFILK